MTPSELRQWLFQNCELDEWWLCLDGVTGPSPVSSFEIELLVGTGQHELAQVLPVSQAEMECPIWFEVTIPLPVAAADLAWQANFSQLNAECVRTRANLARTQDQLNLLRWGDLNSKMVCPHCQTVGKIHTKLMKQKKGISGAKATGALLTGGISILATGLSRKEQCTQAHCGECGSTWTF